MAPIMVRTIAFYTFMSQIQEYCPHTKIWMDMELVTADEWFFSKGLRQSCWQVNFHGTHTFPFLIRVKVKTIRFQAWMSFSNSKCNYARRANICIPKIKLVTANHLTIQYEGLPTSYSVVYILCVLQKTTIFLKKNVQQ